MPNIFPLCAEDALTPERAVAVRWPTACSAGFVIALRCRLAIEMAPMAHSVNLAFPFSAAPTLAVARLRLWCVVWGRVPAADTVVLPRRSPGWFFGRRGVINELLLTAEKRTHDGACGEHTAVAAASCAIRTPPRPARPESSPQPSAANARPCPSQRYWSERLAIWTPCSRFSETSLRLYYVVSAKPHGRHAAGCGGAGSSIIS